jgi:hypothetical protein
MFEGKPQPKQLHLHYRRRREEINLATTERLSHVVSKKDKRCHINIHLLSCELTP